jgi:hypothetical protein
MTVQSCEDAEHIHAIDYFEILTFDNFSKHEAHRKVFCDWLTITMTKDVA